MSSSITPDSASADGTVDLEKASRVIDAPPEELVRLEREAGTLTLFRGGRSMHGVLPVRGRRKRITAILTYDPDPNLVASDEVNCRIYGPRVERILAQKTRVPVAPLRSPQDDHPGRVGIVRR